MNEQAAGLKKLVAQIQNKEGESSKFITITSGKGGVGKTVFAVNYAYMLANKFDKRVLLIDADMGMANIHLFLDVDPKKNIRSLLFGDMIESVVQRSYGFDVLLGFSGIEDIEEISGLSVQAVISDLERVSKNYDYILIDTAAGIDDKIISLIRASTKSYVITTPEPTALIDAYALMRSIYNLYGYDRFDVIVNMYKSKEEADVTFSKLKMTLKKFLGIDLGFLGYLPYTESLKDTVKNKEIMCMKYPKDRYTQHIYQICRNELQEFTDNDIESNFWNKLFEFIGKK